MAARREGTGEELVALFVAITRSHSLLTRTVRYPSLSLLSQRKVLAQFLIFEMYRQVALPCCLLCSSEYAWFVDMSEHRESGCVAYVQGAGSAAAEA